MKRDETPEQPRKGGWQVIQERNKRMELALANRKQAWSADESTGTVRLQPVFFQNVTYGPLLELDECI